MVRRVPARRADVRAAVARSLRAALLGGLALAAGLGGCRPGDPPFPAGTSILLVTIDTLRADHLSAYGYPRRTSPVIDGLAAEGVRFDRAAVQWPKTGPSFASLFTATYSKDNRIVRQVGIPLPLQFRTLAEELQERGYATLAVVANGALSTDFNFDQGFDTYIESWTHERSDGGDPTGARAVTDLAREAFAGVGRERPFFAWIHYLDPHFPYTPPAPWRDAFQGDEHFDPAEKIALHRESDRRQMLGIGRKQILDERDELAFYVARYDAEIAYADAMIGELLEHLRADGRLERTLTIVTADHGESLGDHRYYFDHGRFGFQTCLRVPFIVHFPGVVPPRVDADPVELLHLAPTLLEVAGEKLPDGAWMQGRSLVRRLLGERPPASEVAFSEAGYATGDKWQKVVQDRRFKLIWAPKLEEHRWIGGPEVPFALYDLSVDPDETENVAERHPDDLERLKGELSRWSAAERFQVLVDAAADGEPGEVQEQTQEQLRALGYIE